MRLDEVSGFDWDEGNILKNWQKHKVKHTEAEEVFENKPNVITKDTKHSEEETRYQLFGTTKRKRKILVIFTIRKGKFRIISARDMNLKERIFYEKTAKANTKI